MFDKFSEFVKSARQLTPSQTLVVVLFLALIGQWITMTTARSDALSYQSVLEKQLDSCHERTRQSQENLRLLSEKCAKDQLQFTSIIEKMTTELKSVVSQLEKTQGLLLAHLLRMDQEKKTSPPK